MMVFEVIKRAEVRKVGPQKMYAIINVEGLVDACFAEEWNADEWHEQNGEESDVVVPIMVAGASVTDENVPPKDKKK